MQSVLSRRLGLVGALLGAWLVAGCSSSPTTNTLPNIGGPGGPPPAGEGPKDSGPGSTGGQDSGTGTTTGGDSGTSMMMTGGGDSGMVTAPTNAITANTTWADGTSIAASTTIAAGVTVTVASGATVSFATGATLTIAGTLTSGMAAGSTLQGTGGGAWGGLVVASGGTLTLDGVAITGATTGIDTQSGDTLATYDDATMTGATMPFNVEAGSTLSVTHTTVTGTTGESDILGSFTASYLTYAKGPSSEGIVMKSATAKMSLEDSTFTGSGPSGDMIVSQTGASLHMAYSTISEVHCGFHFDAINEFDISYVSANNNAWGAMLYGSTPGAGPYSIKDSNFEMDTSSTLDAEGTNGTITVDSCYVSGPMTGVTATNAQSAPIPNAGPR
jgi:hypothetical protein